MNPLVLSLMAAVLLFVGLYGIRKGMKQYSKS
jgi:uncharacterized membrane protein